MTSTFSPNKNLEMPSSGSYENAWAAPLNAVIDEIDSCLGGVTAINVTGVTGPTIALTTTQYQPLDIEFSGALTANLLYTVPTGVGGLWSLENNTSGAFSLSFGCTGGTSFALPQGISRTLIICDGTNVGLADSATAAAAQSNAETFATTAANTAQSNAETYAAAQAAAALASAKVYSSVASNLTSAIVPNARLPNPGVGPGVTIAADPGTTPSGAAGAIFYYY